MRIAHYFDGIYLPGGVATYLRDIGRVQASHADEVIYFERTCTKPPADAQSATMVADDQQLFNLCREAKVDLLHYHSRLTNIPVGLPTVVTVHGHSPYCPSGGSYLKRRNIPCPRTYSVLGCIHGHLRDHCGSLKPDRFIRNFSDYKRQLSVLPKVDVVCISEYVKTQMLKVGYSGEALNVINNFTTVDEPFQPIGNSEVPRFLALGRLERSKGFEWLLRSFSELIEPAFLDIAGLGAEEPRLRLLAIELGIANNVVFHGWVAKEKVIQLMKGARAIVVPSIWPEPFGLVAIEAAACGRPAIVSRSGELPIIIRNQFNGLVVEVGDISQLAAAMQKLAKNVSIASELASRNFAKFDTYYRPERHYNELYSVYLRAISQQKNT